MKWSYSSCWFALVLFSDVCLFLTTNWRQFCRTFTTTIKSLSPIFTPGEMIWMWISIHSSCQRNNSLSPPPKPSAQKLSNIYHLICSCGWAFYSPHLSLPSYLSLYPPPQKKTKQNGSDRVQMRGFVQLKPDVSISKMHRHRGQAARPIRARGRTQENQALADEGADGKVYWRDDEALEKKREKKKRKKK